MMNNKDEALPKVQRVQTPADELAKEESDMVCIIYSEKEGKLMNCHFEEVEKAKEKDTAVLVEFDNDFRIILE
jgi:hypothetical protein